MHFLERVIPKAHHITCNPVVLQPKGHVVPGLLACGLRVRLFHASHATAFHDYAGGAVRTWGPTLRVPIYYAFLKFRGMERIPLILKTSIYIRVVVL